MAENGLEATLQADEHFDIDLIILDWELPDSIGPDIFKKIKKNCQEQGKSIPKVVIFTGLDSIERREQVLELGAVDFIRKDLSVAQVILSVNKILRPQEVVSQRGVLIVEDSAVYQLFYKESLGSLNLKLFVALSAEEGLELVKENIGEIDLMVIDNTLPGMNGIEFVRKIRDQYGFKNIPIIFSTSKVHNRNSVLEVLGAGATDFFEKPVIKEEFLSRVETHLTNANLSEILKRNLKKLNIMNIFKNQYTSQICHESRELLENLFGYVEVFDDLVTGEEGKGYLKSMSDSLNGLVGQIKELKASEDNIFANDIDINKFNLRNSANRIIEELAGDFKDKNIELFMEFTEDEKSYSVLTEKNLNDFLKISVNYLLENVKGISEIKIQFIKDGPTKMDIFIHDNGEAINATTLNKINCLNKEDESYKNPLLKIKEVLTKSLSKIDIKSNDKGNHIKISIPIISMKSSSWSY